MQERIQSLEQEVKDLRAGLSECNESIQNLLSTVEENHESLSAKLDQIITFQTAEWKQNMQRQVSAPSRSLSDVHQVTAALPDPPLQKQRIPPAQSEGGIPSTFAAMRPGSLKNNRIPSVVITNAGSSEVNGQYLLNGYCDGKPQYHMHEKDTIFEIFWFPKYKSWMIYRTDAKPNVKYYMAKVDSPKPPDFKWIVLAHGTEPAPQLEGDVFKKSMVGGSTRSMSMADGKAPGRRSNKKMTKSGRANSMKLSRSLPRKSSRSSVPAKVSRATPVSASTRAGAATPTTGSAGAEKGSKTTSTPRSRSLDRSNHRRADSDVDYIKLLPGFNQR